MHIVDMHCDTISRLYESRGDLQENEGHVDLKRMKKAGCSLQNFALFINREKVEDTFAAVMELMKLYDRELQKNQQWIAPVYTYEDFVRNEKDGKMSALLTIEEGAVCKGEVSKLQELYRCGARMLTITWNYPNELGYPNLGSDFLTPDTTHGLTETGILFLEEMESLGMIPDVSHLSDAGFYDVLSHTKKPFVASHSNARKICPVVRNMTDDMIRKLAERGGVIGLNFCEDFLTGLSERQRTKENILDAVICHAEHIRKVGGIGCLGLGSDFDGIPDNRALPDVSAIDRLIWSLQKKGWKSSMIDAVMGENVLRVYREVLC